MHVNEVKISFWKHQRLALTSGVDFLTDSMLLLPLHVISLPHACWTIPELIGWNLGPEVQFLKTSFYS